MNVLLINFTFKENTSGCKLVPLGLAYLHAAVRKEHNVKIINLNYENDIDRLTEEFITQTIHLVGFTVYEGIFEKVAFIARLVKRLSPETIVTIGGPFATYAYEPILRNYKQIDYVVIGEGEIVFEKLLKYISQKDMEKLKKLSGLAYRSAGMVMMNEPIDVDINSLPIPSWDVLYPFPNDGINSLIPICTARGCWGKCIFCSIKHQQGKILRYRDVSNIKEEIELLINTYGEANIFFSEPNFFSSKNRANKILDMIGQIKNLNTFGITTRVDSFLNCEDLLDKLFEVGCRSIEIGIESGSQSQLDRFNKGTTVEMNYKAIKLLHYYQSKYNNILYNIDMINFDPYCTIQELKENLDFFYRSQLNTQNNEGCLYNGMNLFQGTRIREMALKDGLALDSLENPYYDFYDHNVAVIYGYALLFLHRCQNILDELTNIFNKIYKSDIYKANTHMLENMKVLKLFIKRDTIVFNYFRDIITSQGDRESCKIIFQKYEKDTHTIQDTIKNYITIYGIEMTEKS